jgi:hypothetical protein
LRFERYYESIATPFEWKFTREDLHAMIEEFQGDPHSADREVA